MNIIEIFRRSSVLERIIVILMFIAIFGDIGILCYGIMLKNMTPVAIAILALGDHITKTYFVLEDLD